MQIELVQGDCRQALKHKPDCSVDSVVCDPPYELGFMGKGWDSTGVANDTAAWAEALRLLKPGGYLLAFSGTRTYHRMVCAIEDAGFEIRDQIAWTYGSGFPKSHNGPWGGTAFKPAWEPICVARKPLSGTVEQNWIEWGTGALNIDGGRVPSEDGYTENRVTQGGDHFSIGSEAKTRGTTFEPNTAGRWPANLIHDGSDEVVAAFPQAPGQLAAASTSAEGRKTQNTYGAMARGSSGGAARQEIDKSAARFFYCAKASKSDRNEGLDGFAKALPLAPNGAENAVGASRGSRSTARENIHPTVKPTALMQYLVRLVTPAGGVVLDPFLGSGSTGKAAALEGFRFIGCELSAEYLAIARARIDHALYGEFA